MSSAYDLLDKRELRITKVRLDGANLGAIASVTAAVLGLAAEEVLVTDYLDAVLTLDVLSPQVYAHQLVGQQQALLAALDAVPGVSVDDASRVTANGMLGWIAGDAEDLTDALVAAESKAADIQERISRRAVVFSTGQEVLAGQVDDTNRAAITEPLVAAGFSCDAGGTLPDDMDLIAGSIRRAADRGYGLIVTTGGVGAEAKDCTVDAVLSVVPQAATPYLVRFELDHHRHHKDGVRIAVATFLDSRIVCLPGPTDEVRIGIDAVIKGVTSGLDDSSLAESIARPLRAKLRAHMATGKST